METPASLLDVFLVWERTLESTLRSFQMDKTLVRLTSGELESLTSFMTMSEMSSESLDFRGSRKLEHIAIVEARRISSGMLVGSETKGEKLSQIIEFT